MRTPLTDFSREFSSSLRPLLEPFDSLLAAVAQGADEDLAQVGLDELRHIRDQLDVLLTKVEGQQAYVMIFGPLKSGKSTLMNALAGAYVSEVTSLPAYPAVVFVSHADEPTYRAVRYDGSTEAIEDAGELRGVIENAHLELAEAVRAAEREGRTLDPQAELPRAIRRIDARVPAGELAPSEVVLVDTPGLYSRMKFRYDEMTRDFRHAASVAVFVVKPDNLFLEQVFDEFADLLDLFSRVFLVLNVDSSRVDLGPDGELSPSLEQRDPERIVAAFEAYAMNARLRQAEQEGRLRIFPVDLLRAAAARMRARATGDEAAPNLEPGDPGARFEVFRRELIDFLDSNDYLNAFVSDGLTRAAVLLNELEGQCAHTAFRHFVVRLKELVARRDELGGLLEDARELLAFDWERELLSQQRGVAERAEARMGAVLEALDRRVELALDEWFQSSASLEQLIEEALLPQADAASEDMRRFVLAGLREYVETGDGPAATDELASARRRVDLDLHAIGRATLEGMAEVPPPAAPRSRPITAADIPVKRRLTDWLLLRKKETIRRRLFGSPALPSAPIEPALKGRVLGDEGRQAMQEVISRHHARHLRSALETLERDLLQTFANGFAERARLVLEQETERLGPVVAELEAAVEVRSDLAAKLAALRSGLRTSRAGLQSVREKVTPTLRDVELVPQQPPVDAAPEDTEETEDTRESAEPLGQETAQ